MSTLTSMDVEIVEDAAFYVSKNGLQEAENKILADFDSEFGRFNFLKSSDPRHAFYRQKVAEFCALNAQATDSPIDPPPVLRTLIQRTAHYVSTHGLEAEKMMRDRNLKDARYSFLMSSDPFHPLYQQMLTEYAEEPTDSDPCDDKREGYPQPDPQSPFWILKADSLQLLQLDKLKFSLPDGMAPEEFDTINLAAQFVGWYGNGFWNSLTERVIMNHEFEFMKPTDSRYTVFTRLAGTYFRVLMPPEYLEDMLRGNAAYMDTILEVFFHFTKQQWHGKAAMALIDWLASRDGVDVFPPPGHSSVVMMQPPTIPGTSPPPPLPLPVEKMSTDDKGESDPQPDLPPRSRIRAHSLDLHKLKLTLPDGMTSKEFFTIKLTAQFGAWFGKYFWECLAERVIMNREFEFMKPTNSRYTVFTRLIAAYKRVLMPADDMEDMLREYGAYMATILEVFFHFVKQQCHEEVAMALIDWVGLMNVFEFPPAQIQQPGMPPRLVSLFPQLPPHLMEMMQPPTMSGMSTPPPLPLPEKPVAKETKA